MNLGAGHHYRQGRCQDGPPVRLAANQPRDMPGPDRRPLVGAPGLPRLKTPANEGRS